MSNSANPQDPFRAGVDDWMRAMDAGRRALEELGQTMTSSVRGAAPVTAADLERVVQALSLLQKADVAMRERTGGLEGQVQELTETVGALSARVAALQEQLVTLTGAVTRLADVVVKK